MPAVYSEHLNGLAKLNDLADRLARREPVDDKELRSIARLKHEELARALHRRLAQGVAADRQPPHRRVRPFVSGDELGDLRLFCSYVVAEAEGRVPRPGVRVKKLVAPEVWAAIEDSADPAWDKRMEDADELRQAFPVELWDELEAPAEQQEDEEVWERPATWDRATRFEDLPKSLWKRLGKALPGQARGLRVHLAQEWDRVRAALSSDRTFQQRRRTIAAELSGLLKRKDLYDEACFRRLRLPDEAKDLLSRPRPEKADIVRLNRLLLEAAYPRFLAKSAEREPSFWLLDDEVCLVLIEEDASWLADPLVQGQIEAWRRTAVAGKGTRDGQRAKGRLERIGQRLVPPPARGAGRPGVSAEVTRSRYRKTKALLTDLKARYQAIVEPDTSTRLGKLLDQLLDDPEWRATLLEEDVDGKARLNPERDRDALIRMLRGWLPRRPHRPAGLQHGQRADGGQARARPGGDRAASARAPEQWPGRGGSARDPGGPEGRVPGADL